MVNVVPLFRRMHVLFVEDDWVIRQILLEHFAKDSNCQAVSFADPAKALGYLRIQCEADRIFSNLAVGGRGGIDLSSGSSWPCQVDLAIAPGYDAEADRFSAIEAGLGFFRVKAHGYFDLWQLVHHNLSHSSFK
jgi:DNA-binding NtrC family response regulator